MKTFVKATTTAAIATTEAKLEELTNLPAGTLGKRRAVIRETAKLEALASAAAAQSEKHREAPKAKTTKAAPKTKVATKTTKSTKTPKALKATEVTNTSMADAPAQYAKQVIWEAKKAAQKEIKEASKAEKVTPVDTAKAEVAQKEVKATAKAKAEEKSKVSMEEILVDAIDEVLGKIPTRRDKIAEERAAKAEECVTAMRSNPTLFSLPKKVALEVADMLVSMSFEHMDKMSIDDLMRIKGVGPKSAEEIYIGRWELSGRLNKLGEYRVEREAGVPMIKEKVMSFNEKWWPGSKESPVVIKEVLRGESDEDRHLKELGFNPEEVFVTFIGFIKGFGGDKMSPRAAQQKHMWDKWCDHGFKDKQGRTFIANKHGTNAGRKDKVRFVRADVYREVTRFARNGARWGAISTEAKEAGYMGLVMPGTIRFVDYCGIDLKPEHIVFTPSYKKVFPKQHVDFVDVQKGIVSIDVVRDVVQNMGDGQMLFHLSSKLLAQYLAGKSDKEKRQICEMLKKIKNFSARAPYMKGLCIVDVDFHAVLRKLGVKFIKSTDGRLVDIDDIAILADETVFKASVGETGHFRSWEEYCTNWRKYNHHFCALIKEHEDRPHALPFQQMQSMVGANEDDLAKAVDAEIARLNGYKDPSKAAGLVGGDMGKIVKLIPALHQHAWVANREQQAYAKLLAQAMGAVLHGTTHNVFGAWDPIAMLEHVAFVASDISVVLQKAYRTEEEYVIGAIPAHTIVSRLNIKDNDETASEECVFSRNPSTDPAAQCVVKVQRDFGEWEWAFRWSTVVYTSTHSYEVTKVRGDHDGDHFFLCFVKSIIAMAKRANEIWGGRLIDWDAPSTEKHPVWARDMRDYYKKLVQTSQLGYWCDMLTSLVGYGVKGVDYRVLCWLVMAVNVFVDAAKHGMGDVTIPDFVLDFLSLKDENGDVLYDDQNRRIMRPMPIYAMAAKDSHHMSTPEADKKIYSNRCAKKYGAGNGDKSAYNVGSKCPKQLVVDIDKNVKFDVRDLQYNLPDGAKDEKYFGYRGCEELFYKGKYNPETGEFENQGLWIEFCFKRMRDLKELCASFDGKEDNRYAYAEAMKTDDNFRRFAGLEMLREWADTHGKTLEDVYDAATYYTFSMKRPMNPQNEKEEKQQVAFDVKFEAWIKVFGGMALRAIYLRKPAVSGLDEYIDEYADVDDDFIADLLDF